MGLKQDFISLRTPDGHPPQGFHAYPELPRAIFDDFIAAGLIEQDSYEAGGRIVFRLTREGSTRGGA
jgi:hypothetical protein